MIRLGVIGYGYWGPQLVRNFNASGLVQVTVVCDRDAARRAAAESAIHGLRTSNDHEAVLRDPAIDAVAVATPVSTHFDLARQALQARKHVWVEKPLATTGAEAAELVTLAEHERRVLFVDHTYLYSDSVRKISELSRQGKLGDVYYYDSVRINLGLFQHDINVVWDLAVHDVAIIDHLFAERPCAVSATGIANVPGHPENVAYLTIFFPGRQIAHVHVNWLSPVKVRRTLIGGSERMVLWDDLEPSERIKLYDKGIMVQQSTESRMQKLIGYRTGDMWAPQLDRQEALLVAAQAFARAITAGEPTLSDGNAGCRVVRVLEAASESMRRGGQRMELS